MIGCVIVGVCDGWVCDDWVFVGVIVGVMRVVCVVRLHTSLQERTGAQRGRQRFRSYLNERDQGKYNNNKNTHTHYTHAHTLYTRAHTHTSTHTFHSNREQAMNLQKKKNVSIIVLVCWLVRVFGVGVLVGACGWCWCVVWCVFVKEGRRRL